MFPLLETLVAVYEKHALENNLPLPVWVDEE